MSRRAESLVLAFDIGTSSLRSALFDERGRRLHATAAHRSYKVSYTASGGAELVPGTLRTAAEQCLRATLRAHATRRTAQIKCVAASGFWHSLLGLDAAGNPITPIYTWADARSQPDAARLREKFSEAEIHQRTGCMLRSSYWPAKLAWLRRTERAVFRTVRRWTSPADWIFRELFGVQTCSHSMASGTGLYDLNARRWDEELLAFCGLEIAQLDAISDAPVSVKSRAAVAVADAQVFAPIGDGAGSNLGSGADEPGVVAINIGTSAAVRMIDRGRAHRAIPRGLFRYRVDEERALLGGAVSNAGNLRAWCLRALALPASHAAAERALSRDSAAAEALTVLPFWTAERAPTWPEEVRGTICGITQATTPAALLQAITTSTYYRLAEILRLMESARARIRRIVVSGGVLHSPASLRLLADVLGRDVEICREQEASLRGAAIYALGKTGGAAESLGHGRRVRHRPAQTRRHRAGLTRQQEFERLLTPPPSD